jgi:hypothetical protein
MKPTDIIDNITSDDTGGGGRPLPSIPLQSPTRVPGSCGRMARTVVCERSRQSLGSMQPMEIRMGRGVRW